MRKYAGASVVVLGINLTAYGLDTSESTSFRISRLFTVDGPMNLLIVGILSTMMGLSLMTYRRQRV